jgi:hypothetical protein
MVDWCRAFSCCTWTSDLDGFEEMAWTDHIWITLDPHAMCWFVLQVQWFLDAQVGSGCRVFWNSWESIEGWYRISHKTCKFQHGELGQWAKIRTRRGSACVTFSDIIRHPQGAPIRHKPTFTIIYHIYPKASQGKACNWCEMQEITIPPNYL